MNILLISRGWPTETDPKWGCFEKDQAEALKELGHNVKVLCLDCRFSFKPYIPKINKTIINGIDYYSYRGLPQAIVALILGNKAAITLERWMILKLFNKFIFNNYKPDIVYSHFVLNSSAATVLKDKFGLPLVVIEHSSELVKDKLTSIIKDQASNAYRIANKVISVSEYLRQNIKKHFNIDSVVVPNMLGPEFMMAPSKINRNSTERIRFLSVGALLPLKGFSELISAFSKAKLSCQWELNIIGYGELINQLKNQVKKLGLNDNVKFLGAKTKSEIISEMNSSDIFVLNSKRETFGVVYIEALSQGLPCIATKCRGAQGIIGPEDGVNIEVGNETSLISALEHMAINYKQYDKNRIRERCLDKYAPTKVALKIEKILKDYILE